MFWIRWIACLMWGSLFGALSLETAGYSIVFIHVGSEIPPYAETAFMQARLFNRDSPIVLIGNKKALQNFSSQADIIKISCESLPQTEEHVCFSKKSPLSKGFWRSASERFLYLYDFMKEYRQNNVFHLEYDNMVYADLSELLPKFQAHYPGVAACFDNESRCIPGFVYISSPGAMKYLAKCFATQAKHGYNDMELLSVFKHSSGSKFVDNLPIVFEEYTGEHEMRSLAGHTTEHRENYCKNIEVFHSIFDAAAIGQYLGGCDPQHHAKSKAGFINESCLFNPSLLSYEWEKDEKGRKIPYAVYKNKKYRINNLHIHCKNLGAFSS